VLNNLPAWPAFRDRNTSQPMILGDSQERPDPAERALYDALYATLMAVKEPVKEGTTFEPKKPYTMACVPNWSRDVLTTVLCRCNGGDALTCHVGHALGRAEEV
jgi:hypothetical protein